MRSLLAVVSVLALLFTPASLHASEEKLKKPKLELRAAPRMSFSPANVLLTAELTGGGDVEEFYCPEIEWDWDDGGKSTHQDDCAPYDERAQIERRYTAEHEYRKAGIYTAKVTLRHSNKQVAVQTVRITVRPGLGDQTQMPE
jgi:hypothetical protein